MLLASAAPGQADRWVSNGASAVDDHWTLVHTDANGDQTFVVRLAPSTVFPEVRRYRRLMIFAAPTAREGGIQSEEEVNCNANTLETIYVWMLRGDGKIEREYASPYAAKHIYADEGSIDAAVMRAICRIDLGSPP